MSLIGNTEKINSLIAAINALPEAGSGGGEASGESLYEIGTITPAAGGDFSAGATVCTVSGLSFTPKHVVFCLAEASSDLGHTSASSYTLTFCQGGYASTCSAATGGLNKGSAYIRRASVASISLTSDGFSVTITGTKTVTIWKVPYMYIAFG